jgi:hypothetical protein
MDKRSQIRKPGLRGWKGLFTYLDTSGFLYSTTGNYRIAVNVKTSDSVSNLFHSYYLLTLLFRMLSGKDHGEAESRVRARSDNHWPSRVPRQTFNAQLSCKDETTIVPNNHYQVLHPSVVAGTVMGTLMQQTHN